MFSMGRWTSSATSGPRIAAPIESQGLIGIYFSWGAERRGWGLIIRLCEICTEVAVAFVKTSTGYGFVKHTSGDYNYKGATEHQLRFMRAHSGPTVQVKAAGGVPSLDDLLKVRALGFTRNGAPPPDAPGGAFPERPPAATVEPCDPATQGSGPPAMAGRSAVVVAEMRALLEIER